MQNLAWIGPLVAEKSLTKKRTKNLVFKTQHHYIIFIQWFKLLLDSISTLTHLFIVNFTCTSLQLKELCMHAWPLLVNPLGRRPHTTGHKFYKNDLQLGTTQDLTGVPTVLPRLPSWWEGLHSPLPKTHPTLALQALQAHQLLFSFHHRWLLSGAILISKIWLTYMLLNLNSRSTLTKYSRDN